MLMIFTNSLTAFPEFSNYLRTSPGSVYLFLVAKRRKFTHIKALPTSPCSFTKPLLRNPHPLNSHYFIKKRYWIINISSVIIMVIFSGVCVFGSSILVPVDPQKCSLVWYTSKHGVAHNPMWHCRHLNFFLVSLFSAEHTRHRILVHCVSHRLLCLVSCLFRWLVDWGLSSLSCSENTKWRRVIDVGL
jgi:hypothetical protein